MLTAPPSLPKEDTSSAPISSRVERGRVRLLFLDGLRGFSALYVMLFHAHWDVDWLFQPAHYTGITAWLSAFLDFGHAAVDIFIVLSGYCLMLPVARAGGFSIPGGVGRYLFRRGRRILPPYYAALALSLLLIALVPSMRNPGGERWSVAVPAFTPDAILSHLFLVHCFAPQWSSRINPPMWSVGVEWWIYFLFPMVLLPLWRRAGMYVALAVITAATVATHWAPGHPADYMCPWFFALFGFGAAGAFINFSPDAERERNWNWSLISAGSLGLCLLLLAVASSWMLSRPFVLDIVLGASVTAFIIWCGKRAQQTGPSSVVLSVLESRMALWLGNISYSLYLVHEPLLAWMSPVIRATGWSAETRFYVNLAAGLAVSLPIAYVFHRIFERPFMMGHPISAVKVAVSAAVEPAP